MLKLGASSEMGPRVDAYSPVHLMLNQILPSRSSPAMSSNRTAKLACQRRMTGAISFMRDGSNPRQRSSGASAIRGKTSCAAPSPPAASPG